MDLKSLKGILELVSSDELIVSAGGHTFRGKVVSRFDDYFTFKVENVEVLFPYSGVSWIVNAKQPGADKYA